MPPSLGDEHDVSWAQVVFVYPRFLEFRKIFRMEILAVNATVYNIIEIGVDMRSILKWD